MDTKIIAQKLSESLEKISYELKKLEEEVKLLENAKDYKAMPGVEGVFDGYSIVSANGEKIDVPANYAAKSKIVYGDKLKMIEDEGKKVFKQVEKVIRKELTGILSRKDGKWFVLTDANTYKISDIAADFQKAQPNLKAVVLVPENNLTVPFATLEKVEVIDVVGAPVVPVVPVVPRVVPKTVAPKATVAKPRTYATAPTSPAAHIPAAPKAHSTAPKKFDVSDDDLN